MKTLKLVLVCGIVLILLVAGACGGGEAERAAAAMTGGEPARGREKIRKYGCATCHTIPGIAEADKLVGPPLTQIASRTYIAGVMTNTPDNMIHWIQNPHEVDDKTAMPNLDVTDADARDIAGYLYTLK